MNLPSHYSGARVQYRGATGCAKTNLPTLQYHQIDLTYYNHEVSLSPHTFSLKTDSVYRGMPRLELDQVWNSKAGDIFSAASATGVFRLLLNYAGSPKRAAL